MTRIEGDAPMGRLMREHYWIPFALSAHLVHGDAPMPVRLFGENYVAFRAEDGRVGFLDELCPHRRASLLLGRIEGNAVRCIYHGWKIDVSGCVVECPTQALRPERFAGAACHVVHFPVHEAGGLAWVWLGGADGDAALPRAAVRRRGPVPLLVRLAGPVQLAPGPRGLRRLRPRRDAAPDLDRPLRRHGGARQPQPTPSPRRRRPTRPSPPRTACGRRRCARPPTVEPTCASPST